MHELSFFSYFGYITVLVALSENKLSFILTFSFSSTLQIDYKMVQRLHFDYEVVIIIVVLLRIQLLCYVFFLETYFNVPFVVFNYSSFFLSSSSLSFSSLSLGLAKILPSESISNMSTDGILSPTALDMTGSLFGSIPRRELAVQYPNTANNVTKIASVES